MDQFSRALTQLQEMDELAAQQSPIHRLHPLSKLLVTVAYILTVVSYPKYDYSGLVVMVLYPILLFQLSGIPVRTCFYKLRLMLPLVCAVGLANPFFDRAPLLQLGTVTVSGGVVSMVTLVMKGVFALMASFLLVATTSMDALCAALRKLHVPGILVTLLLLTYRYVALMVREVGIMNDAYRLRAPGQKGIRFSAWGSFLGQLLLRSMDRAEELYQSMLLRGFRDDFCYVTVPRGTAADGVYGLVCVCCFLLARWINVAQLAGSLLV